MITPLESGYWGEEVDVVALGTSNQAKYPPAGITPENMPNFVSCRVTNSILKYLESLGIDAASITDRLPVSHEYLTNSLNWISADIRDTLAARAVEITKDNKIMYRVGLATPRLSAINGFEFLIRFLGTPEKAFRKVPQYANLFDKSTIFEIENLEDGQATVILSLTNNDHFSRQACYYAQGILAAIPTVWGLPPASVEEIQCILDDEDNSRNKLITEEKRCIYKVTWEVPEKKAKRITDRLFRHLPSSSDIVPKLEENFRQLDEKNAELVARNAQLSAIREIALGIDNVRTVDQVMELVVEKARDIQGIRFAMVYEVDEKSRAIDVTYYSKARGPLEKELKALGFDPETYLEKNPTNRTFVFSLDQMGTDMDMSTNPRLIVKQHLYELADRAVPRTICDTIERILKIESIVLVPIIIDGKVRSSMMFFITGKVPTDILEMVAAHCATALKNVQNIESLEKKNRELSAINNITNRISFVHDLQDQLNGALEEILGIFTADAASIHTISSDGKFLDMVAQRGMPETVAAMTQHFPLKNSIAGQIYSSDISVFKGDMADFLKQKPEYQVQYPANVKIPYLAVRLDYDQDTRGVLILVRYRNEPFTSQDITLFLSIAGQISICLENSRLHREVSASEERLNMIVQSTAEGIIEIDLKGFLIRVNNAVVKMHGYTSQEEMIGLSIFDLISECNRDLATKSKIDALMSGSSAVIEYDFRRKGGSLFRGEASAALLRDIHGKPIGFVIVTEDITKRKQDEETLIQNEANLTSLINSIQTGILVIDPDTHHIVQANEYALRMIGLGTEQLIGHICHNFVCPAEKGHCPITDLNQKVDVSERVLLNSRNEKIPVLKSVVPLLRNGKEYLVESFVDITERSHMEKALRDSQRKYSLIAESTVDYIAIMDMKGEYLYLSPSHRQLGYDPEALIGRSGFDFIHPEDKRFLFPLLAKYAKMKLKELFGLKNDIFSVPISFRVRDAQGKYHYMESNASAMESNNGKEINVLMVSRDLTEKRQAETELHRQKDLIDRALNITPNAVAAIDQNMFILMANQSFQNYYTGGQDIEGKLLTEEMVPGNIVDLVKKVAANKRQVEKLEYQTETANGVKTYHADILSMGEGEVLLIITDLTKEREQEAKMYLTERLASVGEMASGIAHELNNPLTSVIGLSALLAEENLPDNVGEDVQAICQEARRASQIVKNLLSFARRHEQKRQLTQITDVITDVLKLRTYEQKANNITTMTSFNPDIPEVMVDYFQMQQAFLNIILNAEQAMHETHGRGNLNITVKKHGGAVRVSFSDDGPGIKATNQKRIFDPFFTTKEVGKGTGLGLSITYGIIKAHDGKIWVESEPGQGSTFVIEIPVYSRK